MKLVDTVFSISTSAGYSQLQYGEVVGLGRAFVDFADVATAGGAAAGEEAEEAAGEAGEPNARARAPCLQLREIVHSSIHRSFRLVAGTVLLTNPAVAVVRCSAAC